MIGPRVSRCLTAMMLAALVASGCGDRGSAHSDHHGHDHGAADGDAVSFKEGQGLKLADATREAIGIETAELEERPIARVFTVTATVFDAGPPARALTLVPPEIADELERITANETKVLSIRRDLSSALTQVEVVLALPGSPPVGAAQEVAFRSAGRSMPALPRSAVLRTATGTYVYVVNGSHFLRTAITTGASDEHHFEVTEGLYPGDVVVTSAVEELWLTELRLTKGGGHSH